MSLQDPTVFIDIREPEDDTVARLAEIFVNAIGLTGLFAVFAIVIGAIVAVLLVRRRMRSRDDSSGDILKS